MEFADQFMRDISMHKMTAIRDEGVYRHLRFQTPGTYCMGFDIITWPGYLAYTGDMGTYVFTRTNDMFSFFRIGAHPRLFNIDKRYWAEKCECGGAADRSGIREFSNDRFAANIREYVVYWIRTNRDRTSKNERRDLWEAVKDEVLNVDGDGGGYRKQIAARDFSQRLNPSVVFHFQDFWERSNEEFTHGFLWCCHALAWAISTYDASKAPVPDANDEKKCQKPPSSTPE